MISTSRETGETRVEASLEILGSGQAEVETGVEMLDFLLSTLVEAGRFDLTVTTRGDLETGDHHTVEDVGITLGLLLSRLNGRGTGSSTVPSRDCLAGAAVRFGESCFKGDFEFQSRDLGDMTTENFSHLLRSLAYNGRLTLHLWANGGDDLRRAEAMMAALGRALKRALLDGETQA